MSETSRLPSLLQHLEFRCNCKLSVPASGLRNKTLSKPQALKPGTQTLNAEILSPETRQDQLSGLSFPSSLPTHSNTLAVPFKA